jgi:hypothetical protein
MEQLFAQGGDYVRPDVAFAVLKFSRKSRNAETQAVSRTEKDIDNCIG